MFDGFSEETVPGDGVDVFVWHASKDDAFALFQDLRFGQLNGLKICPTLKLYHFSKNQPLSKKTNDFRSIDHKQGHVIQKSP